MYCYYQVIIFQRAEKFNGDANRVDDERNRMASIFLPINPLKMVKINTSRFDVSKCFESRLDLKVYPVWLIDSLEVRLWRK